MLQASTDWWVSHQKYWIVIWKKHMPCLEMFSMFHGPKFSNEKTCLPTTTDQSGQSGSVADFGGPRSTRKSLWKGPSITHSTSWAYKGWIFRCHPGDLRCMCSQEWVLCGVAALLPWWLGVVYGTVGQFRRNPGKFLPWWSFPATLPFKWGLQSIPASVVAKAL